MFFQSADLSLGDTNLISYLHLGFSLVEAEIDNVTFTLQAGSWHLEEKYPPPSFLPGSFYH